MENEAVPQKIKHRITIQSSNSTFELKAEPLTGICIPMIKAALFTIAKKWKQPRSIDEGIDKQYTVFTKRKYYSALTN